jgi:hypothetical protein
LIYRDKKVVGVICAFFVRRFAVFALPWMRREVAYWPPPRLFWNIGRSDRRPGLKAATTTPIQLTASARFALPYYTKV